MAIVDMKGTVSKDRPTMTGMMNEAPKTVDPPKLSGMNKLFQRKEPAPAPVKEDAPMQSNDLVSKVNNLPDEDKAVLTTVLSPSVSNVLVKLAPELAPLVEAAGVKEENVIIPVSMCTNFAVRICLWYFNLSFFRNFLFFFHYFYLLVECLMDKGSSIP